MFFAITGIGSASLHSTDPYVDVYVPGGINGATSGELRVDTPSYKFAYNCGKGFATEFTVKNTPAGDLQMFDAGKTGCHALSMRVNGEWYSVSNHDKPRFVRFHKSGKYMWEIQLEDIELRNKAGKELPLTVSETFYFWPDKIYSYIEITPKSNITSIEYAELSSYYKNDLFNHCNNGTVDKSWTGDTWVKGSSNVPNSFTMFSTDSKAAVTQSVVDKTGTDLWMCGTDNDASAPRVVSRLWLWNKDQHGGKSTVWEAGTARTLSTAYYAVPEGISLPGLRETACDAHPLRSADFTISESNAAKPGFNGFDLRRGCYNLELEVPAVAYWDVDKNFVSEMKLDIRNNRLKRNMRIRTYDTPVGHAMYNITGTFPVLCDADRNPTGIPVQVSKKWDGNTHPNYHETYMYLPFDVKESQTYWYRIAYHMWGTKTLVGIPSLDLIDWPGVYGPWYETHIGSSETVCYSMDDRILPLAEDFRAQNGTQFQGNAGSCWFDNAGGASLTSLMINGEIQRMKRRAPGLRWTSPGPCLAQQSWFEETFPDVAAARTTAAYYFIPSMRNTRIFYKYRTEFKERQKIADMKTDIRLFTLNEENYSPVQVPSVISYLGKNGKIVDMKTDYTVNKWLCTGVPLSPNKPFVAGHTTITGAMDPKFYPAGVNNNGFVVHSFSGKIGGKKIGMDKLCLSAFQRTDTKCVLNLTPNVDADEILPGDYVDLLIEMFTWHPDDGNTAAIEAERLYNPTTVKVNAGKKVSDFPAHVEASNQLADFYVTGGIGFNAIRASGFKSHIPQLEELVNKEWVKVDQSVKGKDWWQTDYNPSDGTYTFTFAVPAPDKDTTKRYRIRSL
ncbi:MAG: hypothetical protein ACYC27_04940 [Armatimonadota bacterium]